MSRRAPSNPTAERAAQNQQTLKTLVKIESNKSCADCKRNKHPRWASWNLGVFLCIRCSGIHRGMGTHISRVKSVDLDAWTDDQMQNMIRWGNARANKYWEAKLAPGHVPQEGKIENFIRTKYDSKRWVMDGGMPDPATLDAGDDDDVPLTVVQEKAKINAGSHGRVPSGSTAARPPPQARNNNPDIDLFGDSHEAAAPTRTVATTTTSSQVPPPTPPKANVSATKTTKPGESLLGFDFFGDSPSNVPARPSSAASSISNSNAPSRPDLKQSILSLYASAPKPTPASPPPQTGPAAGKSPPPQSGFGSLESDFKSLNFGSSSTTQTPMSPPRASSAAPSITSPKAAPPSSGGGGGFFDAMSSPPLSGTTPPTTTAQQQPPPAGKERGLSASSGFGDFSSATSPGVSSPPAAPKPSSNGLGDLFDFSSEPAPPPQKLPQPTPPATTTNEPVKSPFNLSSPVPSSAPKPAPQPAPLQTSNSFMTDPWGSNEAWASSSNTGSSQPPPKAPATISPAADDWGWGDAGASKSTSSGGFASAGAGQTQITADEDFGGWESSTVVSPTVQSRPGAAASPTSSAPPPRPLGGGFSTNTDDLFSNVWE